MAIQRAAALPAPAPEVSQARATLARRYGALVWDGPDRRVLLVRTPRKDPDPVNDVEEAVEFLRPDDVKDITHCLLIGDEAVAQVYTRPLQDLMRQREEFDRAMAASWRERLPGNLAHVLFQAPEDPRRRWRLAIRIPAGTIQELDESMLEDLADGIGPELQTARMQQVCAVYLIASHDDVRLEADMFIEQMTATWQDEDRRRRAELAQAQRRDEERRRKEEERRLIVAEMERKIDETTRRAARAGPARSGASPYSASHSAPYSASHSAPYSLPHSPPSAQEVPPARALAEPRGVEARKVAPSPQALDREGPRPLAEASATITAREVRHLRNEVDRLPTGPWVPDLDSLELEAEELASQQGQEQAAAVDKLDELRQRVDRAVKIAPLSRPPTRDADRAGRRSSGAPARRTTPRIDPETRLARAGADRAAAHRASDASAHGGPDEAFAHDGSDGTWAHDGSNRATHLGPEGARAHRGLPGEQRPKTPSHLVPARDFLVAAGFEVLEAPATTHAIDLAAERLEGDPQRVVVRVVERLDPDVAKDLLKTARELEVDLVLCIADQVIPEGKRLLVATKIKVVGPGDLAQLQL